MVDGCGLGRLFNPQPATRNPQPATVAWQNRIVKRSGVADLPLHGGRVPPWLAARMVELGTGIAESVLHHYGPRRAAVAPERSVLVSGPRIGDGHGLALVGHHDVGDGRAEEGAQPARARAGRSTSAAAAGRQSRETPRELREIASRTGLDGEALVRTSRLTARVDNNAVADGFQIYLHAFVLTADGQWAIVQQGMNEASRLARRYHWHSATVRDFTADPHAAIVGEHAGTIQNLVDARARPAQQALLTIARQDPSKTVADVRRLVMPAHHDVRRADVNERRLGAVLALAHERDLADFASFLLLEQLGPRTLQSLALVAEVVHGTPTRFDDPARFSFAHGGKDGHPFPVPLRVYDESIAVLRRALDSAKLGRSDKLDGMARLDRFARGIEQRVRPGRRRGQRPSPASASSRRRSADGRSSTIDAMPAASRVRVASSISSASDRRAELQFGQLARLKSRPRTRAHSRAAVGRGFSPLRISGLSRASPWSCPTTQSSRHAQPAIPVDSRRPGQAQFDSLPRNNVLFPTEGRVKCARLRV